MNLQAFLKICRAYVSLKIYYINELYNAAAYSLHARKLILPITQNQHKWKSDFSYAREILLF
jgi:hypothetical protein